jgi:hypothetical protein
MMILFAILWEVGIECLRWIVFENRLKTRNTVRPWRPKLNSETITFWITKSFRKNKIEFLDLSELKVEE